MLCCALACCRQALKEYSNWPTFPQLYVDGELIGGCDIVLDMQQSGELQQLLKEKASAALQQPPKQQQQRQVRNWAAASACKTADHASSQDRMTAVAHALPHHAQETDVLRLLLLLLPVPPAPLPPSCTTKTCRRPQQPQHQQH